MGNIRGNFPDEYKDNLYYQAWERWLEQEKLTMADKQISKELMEPNNTPLT